MKAKIMKGAWILAVVVFLNVLWVLPVLLVRNTESYGCLPPPTTWAVADLEINPEHAVVNQTVVEFDASDSTTQPPPSVEIIAYQFYYDENASHFHYEEKGDPDFDGKATYVYEDVGNYTAKVTAYAANGTSGSATHPVYVHTVPEVWYVDGDSPCDQDCDGTTWAKAFHDLQEALALADYFDEVRVAEGTYYPTDDGDQEVSFEVAGGVTVKGGYAGVGASDPDERDIRQYETILSGDIDGDEVVDGDNSYTVVFCANGDAGFDGLTITGGNGMYGSGIYWGHTKTITIQNCIIRGNKASRQGGGMYLSQNGGAELINCFFVDNEAVSGGGLMVCHDAEPVEITNCVFSGNKATGDSIRSNGGGLYNGGITEVTNCTFYGNDALKNGGGIYNSNSTMNAANCILWGNRDSYKDQTGSWNTDESAQISYYRSIPSVVYSCIEELEDGGDYDEGTNVGADPLFGDSANPAGFDNVYGTWDDGLQLSSDSSSCMDNGLDSAVEGIEKDILGNARIFDGDGDEEATVDRGAYEYNYSTPWPYYKKTQDCAVCGNDGDLFPTGGTPVFVKVTFEGVNLYPNQDGCSEPFCPEYILLREEGQNEFSWILKGDGSTWDQSIRARRSDTESEDYFGTWKCYWDVCDSVDQDSYLSLLWTCKDPDYPWIIYSRRYFKQDSDSPCLTEFTDNELDDENECTCVRDGSGTASVSWGPEIGEAEFIAQWPEWQEGYHYLVGEQAKYYDSGWKVYKCNTEHTSTTGCLPSTCSYWDEQSLSQL